MGIWLKGIKDTVKGAGEITYGWLLSAIVLGIILLIIWVIVSIYNSIWGT